MQRTFLDELHKVIVPFQHMIRLAKELIALHMQNPLRFPIDKGNLPFPVDHQYTAGHVR
ncbi:hypothetical protein D3C77_422170 [compost metagenome]